MSASPAPAISGAPKLAKRAGEVAALVRELGFSAASVRMVRTRTVLAAAQADALPEVHRHTVRQLDATLTWSGRTTRLVTTNLQPEALAAQLQGTLQHLQQGPPELFAPANSSSWRAPPPGPFDALDRVDPALSPADPGVVRGLALALAKPTGATVSVKAVAQAEAVARTDGAQVAGHHTRIDLSMASPHLTLTRSSRRLAQLPVAGRLVDLYQGLAGVQAAPPVALGPAPERLLVHPEAASRLVTALVGLPMRTGRLAERLSVLADPWVAGGLGAQPFDARGQATRPVPLIEGGLQRRRHTARHHGDLRVALGGKRLARLVGESDRGLVVRGWRRVEVHPATGAMHLEGYGWRVVDGTRAAPVPRMVVSGRLPELFAKLVGVGADPWAFGGARAPTLVFEPVEVTA